MCDKHLAAVLPNNTGLTCDSPRYSFQMANFGTHTAYNSFTDPTEIRIMNKFWHFKADDIVLDVGAAFGTYTLPALADGARVYAFEPNKHLVRFLGGNVALNKWSERCVISPFGLGALEMEIPYNNMDLSTSGKCDTTIKICRLDDVVGQLGISQISMIKVDIEGMEDQFLQGGRETIQRLKPNFLIEIHNKRTEVVKFFSDLRMKCEISGYNTGREYLIIKFPQS